MFYRLGKIKCKTGIADEVLTYFRNNENTFNNTEGINSLSYFKSGNDEVIGVALWESRDSIDASAERVQSMMAGLTEYIISLPEISEGILEYQFNKK
tara:strand:- start:100 stop:390 length:291 start_codon:yes stop_codon:yes gene_type:complete